MTGKQLRNGLIAKKKSSVESSNKTSCSSAELDQLIKERDEAQDAADKMASFLLGEPIDWAFHDEAWGRAIEQAKYLRENELDCNTCGEAADICDCPSLG